jgi:predicted RNA-binding protein with PUA-like domain
MAKRYWLVKSEPENYSIDDLERDGKTPWDGVRNYQARNTMRDDMKVGDGVFYYHSGTKEPGIVGLARVASKPYADATQFDPDSKYFDTKASPDNVRWILVDLEFVARLDHTLTLETLKADPRLTGMPLLQKGQRLSVQPVDPKHWRHICKRAGVESL